MPPKKKKITQPQQVETEGKDKITGIQSQHPQNKGKVTIGKDLSEKEIATSEKSKIIKDNTQLNSTQKQHCKKSLDFYQKCLVESTLKLQGKRENKYDPDQELTSRKRVFEQTEGASEQGQPQKKVKKEGKCCCHQIVSSIVEEDPKILEDRRKKFCAPESTSGPAIYQEPLPIRKDSRVRKFYKKKQQNVRPKQILSRQPEPPKETKPKENHHIKRRDSRQKQSHHKSKHSRKHQSHHQVYRHHQEPRYKSHSNHGHSHSKHHHHQHHRR